MSRYTLSIEALEDIHVGTGLGEGDINDLQSRDRKGRPCLPATHLKGVFRAQAETLPDISPDLINALFGAPGARAGALALTSAWLIKANENAQGRPGVAKDAATIVWGSTRVDPKKGSAAENTLRFVEYVRAGCCFRASLYLPDEPHLENALRRILAGTTHLGHGRHRGYGRIRVKMEKEVPSTPTIPQTLPDCLPARLRLLLRNLDPLCLAQTGHPGNVIPSESFIRARAVRGALAARAIASGNVALAQELHRAGILWGDALPLPDLGDAFLSDENLARCLVKPIPLSIGTPKERAPDGLLPWWAQGKTGNRLGDRHEIDRLNKRSSEEKHGKLKRPGDEYLYRPNENAPWRRYKPQIPQRLRTQVPDREKPDQALFSNEEIAENTCFLCDIIVKSQADAPALLEALRLAEQDGLRMGRGGRPVVVEAAAWLPGKTPQPDTGQDEFCFLCESDLILRDEMLRYHTRLDAKVLADWLGMEALDVYSEPGHVFSDFRRIFGFNATSGLPRPVQVAIKAGSAMRIRGLGARQLREALAQKLALGECVEEGFGRFSLDDIPRIGDVQKPPPLVGGEAEKSNSLCQQALDWAKQLGGLKDISAAQLGEARGRALAAQNKEDIEKLFSDIQEAAQKHGGKNWQCFTEHACFKNEVFAQPLPDAQALLDYFFRWCSALRKENEQ
jgi:hypothetical protein